MHDIRTLYDATPGHVILSAAKNLSERPFTSFRVTTLVCRSLEVWFRGKQQGGLYDLDQDAITSREPRRE